MPCCQIYLVLCVVAFGYAKASEEGGSLHDFPELSGFLQQGESRVRRSGSTCNLVVLFDNQLDRLIKVIPSEGSVGKYFVEPRGFLQVNISVECVNVTFNAVDQEKQVSVLLNNSGIVTFDASTRQGQVQNIVISPQALNVIPSRSYSLLEIVNGEIAGYPPLSAHGTIGAVQGGGLAFDGTSSYLAGTFPTGCLLDPSGCTDGFSMVFKLKVDGSAQNDPNATYVIDTGAHGDASTGVTAYLKNGKVYCQLNTNSRKWETNAALTAYEISLVIMTWHPSDGMQLYMNAQLLAVDSTGIAISTVAPHSQTPNLNIGRNVLGPAYSYGKFDAVSFTIFDTHIEADDILNVHMFLWSSYMATGYYSIIRTVNIGQRNARLFPEKGYPTGFQLQPYQLLGITVIDLTTDGSSPSPILFTAKDDETSIPLLLNGNINGVYVTPVITPSDETNLVAKVQATATSPEYTLPTVKIEHGTVPSTPALSVYGNVVVVADSLLFDGVNGYLSGGNVTGCIADPNICTHGFTLGMKVKFNAGFADHAIPKVLFDSGAQDGVGISVSLVLNKVCGAVALGTTSYKACSNLTTFDTWIVVTVQYSAVNGIFLYFDSAKVGESNTAVPFGGTGSPVAELTFGRESTGLPMTYANFGMEVAVFYETFLQPTELAQALLYYWSYASTVALDRFISVDFENNAGKDVRVYSDAGPYQQTGLVVPTGQTVMVRLSEQGLQSDFPLTFTAEDATTSDTVLIENQYSFLAVQKNSNATVSVMGLTNPP